MQDLNYKRKSLSPARRLKPPVIALLALLMSLSISASKMLAQSSTLSTPTNNVIVIGGQKFVLVPEKAFGKIEKMVDELPALRTENSSLKAKDANSQAIIDRDTQIIALKDQVITSTETARLAETKRADAEKDRAEALQKGLDISEADRTKLQAQVKKYRRYAVIGAIATIATYILLR